MRTEKLSFAITRQLLPSDNGAQAFFHHAWPGPFTSDQQASGASHSYAGITEQLDSSIVYLGEICVFDVVLSNQGAAVSALTIKVECSVEGGSTAVLYDNSHNPLQQLPLNGHEQLRVQTDIKEQGLMTIVASAVFTDHTGERKYHVQFFKYTSASPVSVRTRVRHLPHIITQSSSSSSAAGADGTGCSLGKTRCFLEVNVQNSTQLQMMMHAVRLLAAAGVQAQQMAACDCSDLQQQHQQPQMLVSQPQQQQQQGTKNVNLLHDPSTTVDSAGSDIASQHDTDGVAAAPAGPFSADAPSVHPKQQQQQQQQQQHMQMEQHWQQQMAPTSHAQGAAAGPGQQSTAVASAGAVVLPAGCSHNALWQVDHVLPALATSSSRTEAAAASAASGQVGGPAAPPAGPSGLPGSGSSSGPSSTSSSSGGSSSTLGRLELHWSTCDGRTGRLLTQPLSGPVPASGKEVLMQLNQLLPGAVAVAVPQQRQQQQRQQQLCCSLTVNEPFTAVFTLTSGLHDMGPLVVLYTTTPPPPVAAAAGSNAGNGGSSSGQLGSSSSSVQSRRYPGVAAAGGAHGSSLDGSQGPEVVVQGSRSRRVAALSAGQSVDVAFELLPLRRGWLTLPTFVVASEADGRLLDGVHDVHVLVE